MVYSTTGNPSSVSQLSSVISSHKEYITMTTKGDVLAGEAPSKDEIIATDEQKVAKCLYSV